MQRQYATTSVPAGALSLMVGLMLFAPACVGDEPEPLPNVAEISLELEESTAGEGSAPDPADPSDWTEQAPEQFAVEIATTNGTFVIDVKRSDAPHGADRFYNLVNSGYLDDNSFFRVIPNYLVQFGINGQPAISNPWYFAKIPADPLKLSNEAGTIAFATSGTPGSRTTQLYINTVDNQHLDAYKQYVPFGRIRPLGPTAPLTPDGELEVVRTISAVHGSAPSQQQIYIQGDPYLQSSFPELDYTTTVRVVGPQLFPGTQDN